MAQTPEALKAFLSSGFKALFGTKDFLFGETAPEDRSMVRRDIQRQNDELTEASPIIGGLSSGIGQFAVSMTGLGKAGMVAKALPYVGQALASGKTAVKGLKYGRAGVEAGKAALAGAIAFDPREARLSNLIRETPLANPISEWIAAKSGDSAAWGVKNAMEKVGESSGPVSVTGGFGVGMSSPFCRCSMSA